VSIAQPGSLSRFWLWAVVGVLASFGTFSAAGAVIWPLLGAGIGVLAARAVDRRATVAAVAAGIAGPVLAVALGAAWPVALAVVVALALALVRTRREAAVLALGLAAGGAAVAALWTAAELLAAAFAPALLILAALAAGRPQREAAGALTGTGLALFAFGAPKAGIPLALAGGVLWLALGMRRRRLAVTGA
jgi:hypothetical protein